MAFSHAQFHRNSVNYYHDLRWLRTILLCKNCAGKPAYGHTQIWPNNCCQWRESRLHTIYRVYFLSNCKDIDYPENCPKTTSVFAQEEKLNENGRHPGISHAALAWLVGITPDGVKYHLLCLTHVVVILHDGPAAFRQSLLLEKKGYRAKRSGRKRRPTSCETFCENTTDPSWKLQSGSNAIASCSVV